MIGERRRQGRARRTATAAALMALLEDGPLRKTDLQAALGCSNFDFGAAIATLRLHGFIELHGGLVQASKAGLEMLEENRRRLDTDRDAG